MGKKSIKMFKFLWHICYKKYLFFNTNNNIYFCPVPVILESQNIVSIVYTIEKSTLKFFMKWISKNLCLSDNYCVAQSICDTIFI